jgi:ComF family protein
VASARQVAPRHELIDALGIAAVDVLELLLPRVCIVCSQPMRSDHHLVCSACWAQLPFLPKPRCDRCGHPNQGSTCAWCSLLPPYVRAARSLCWERSDTTAQSIVHALKYGGWPAIADEMAARMVRMDWPADVLRERTALVPVPLAPTRRCERGFNQSELLAHALARRWPIPVWGNVLTRIRHTPSQTRLTPMDRLRNVSGAFRADASAIVTLRGAHIVLVDDVVTTASTLNACAAALYEGGARILSYVTFARAPAVGDRCP